MFVIKASQKVQLNVAFTDKYGNQAVVDGKPEWSVSNVELGSVEVAEDGLSVWFVPTGKVGQVQVSVQADADLGEGVNSIIGIQEFDVVAGTAAVIQLNVGSAVEKE